MQLLLLPWFELDDQRYEMEITSLVKLGVLVQEDAIEKADGILKLLLIVR